MAVRNRILNSTTPFTGSHIDKSSLLALGSRRVQDVSTQGKGLDEDPLSTKIPPLLCEVLTHGTAKHIGTGQLVPEKRSAFIAQAECEGQQEFSPSSHERTYIASPNCLVNRSTEECNNVASRVLLATSAGPQHCCPPRRRKRQRRKKEMAKKGEQRTLPGVPEQESIGSLQGTQETTACMWTGCSIGTNVSEKSRTHALGIQETAEPDCLDHKSILSSVCVYGQESGSELDSPVDCTLPLQGLRGNVCQEDRCFVPPFYRQVEKEFKADIAGAATDVDVNEGLLFHPEEKLQPNDYEYREEKDYSLLSPIQSGSYGNVFHARDNSTGFECAAKKVPLELFSSEEVGTWSVLNSPRVVELFGVVREGPFVTFFMALKSSSVGQLLKRRGRLPEDLALHYLCQVLEGLRYLQRKGVVHLDVKADNVLLSEDGKDTYLCDFGQSQRLAQNSTVCSGVKLCGTETHMAPEVVRGGAVDSKADVWSSSCMLLHLLNGCAPWTRYYRHPLCLKIASEPPPLREIPRTCSPHTASIIRAGLVKDPVRRASAKELREMGSKALIHMGGLISPVEGAYQEPEAPEMPGTDAWISRDIPSFLISPGPGPITDTFAQETLPPHALTEEVHENAGVEEQHDVAIQHQPPGAPSSLRASSSRASDVTLTATEQELHKLERDLHLSSLSQLYSPEHLLSCFSSDYVYHTDLADKDLAQWSVSTSTDLSSGVFSYSSQADVQSCSVDWLGRTNHSTYNCLEGVDIYIKDLDGHCLKIRETRKIKVGHLATAISKQISVKAFSLEAQDGRTVSPDDEVCSSRDGLHLYCTLAPNSDRDWRWRVKNGVLETRD